MYKSPLAEIEILSPFNSGKRTDKIDRITPHCVVGQCTAEGLGEWFTRPASHASSNYGIGFDGKIGLYVPEDCKSWCSSNGENDNRAITIECASDTYHPYTMTPAVIKSLIALCVDICKRYDKTRLIWIADKKAALSYPLGPKDMLFTVHRWFDNKACPGDFLFYRLGDIAQAVTNELEATTVYYEKLEEVPEWGRATIGKLIDKGAIQGDGNGLHLSYDLVRILVILDRMGVLDNG